MASMCKCKFHIIWDGWYKVVCEKFLSIREKKEVRVREACSGRRSAITLTLSLLNVMLLAMEFSELAEIMGLGFYIPLREQACRKYGKVFLQKLAPFFFPSKHACCCLSIFSKEGFDYIPAKLPFFSLPRGRKIKLLLYLLSI